MSDNERLAAAEAQYKRGRFYATTSDDADRQSNLTKALTCFQAALETYTLEAFPVEWAAIQYELGNIYRYLQEGDHYAHLRKSLACLHAS